MTTQKKFVAYYRVSCTKQKIDGLGMEAQKATVKNYVKCSECIVAEFVEVESGKKDNRTELNKALQMAKETGATLIIAKLDRLSRNVAFLFQLRDSGVKFECCDLPDLNTMSLGIFATFAQYEREKISQRTSDALQAKKARGEKVGNAANFTDDTRAKGREAYSEKAANNENTKKAENYAKLLKQQGLTLQAICDRLNSESFKTAKGKQYAPNQVKRLIDRSATAK